MADITLTNRLPRTTHAMPHEGVCVCSYPPAVGMKTSAITDSVLVFIAISLIFRQSFSPFVCLCLWAVDAVLLLA